MNLEVKGADTYGWWKQFNNNSSGTPQKTESISQNMASVFPLQQNSLMVLGWKKKIHVETTVKPESLH
jgi:hypothetical protein